MASHEELERINKTIQTQGFAFLTLILLLFFPSRPTTVSFTVIPIVINSVYCRFLFTKLFNMFKVRFIHIISKPFKGFPQTLNSSFSIMFIVSSFRVVTAFFNSKKDIVKSCIGKSMFPIRVSQNSPFSINASTTFGRLRGIVNNTVLPYDFLYSTLTKKFPIVTCTFSINKPNCGQSIELLSSNIIHYFIPKGSTRLVRRYSLSVTRHIIPVS